MRKLAVPPLLAFLLLVAQDGMADDFRVIPNASIREEYNDNMFFSEDTEQDDFITTASVGLGNAGAHGIADGKSCNAV
jgi:hypothetical protein